MSDPVEEENPGVEEDAHIGGDGDGDNDSWGQEDSPDENVVDPPFEFPSSQSDKFFRNNTLPFYDRHKELSLLKKAVDRVSLEWMENQNEIIWVSGEVGVGKSTMINEATERVFMNDLHVVCKSSCEEHNTGAKPLNALTECLNDLCDKLQEKGGKATWKPRLDEALGGEGPLLATVVPKVKDLMEIEPLDSRRLLSFDVNSRRRFERLAFAMRDFLQAVSEVHPLVMIVDNIQWADLDSLKIIQDLVTTKAFQNFLLIGCYEPVDKKHPFEMLRKFVRKKEIRTTQLELEPFALDGVEEILRRAFLDSTLVDEKKSTEKVTDLAKVLFSFTKGNPLYTMLSLRLLNDKNLLDFEKSKERWNWNKLKVKQEVKLWRENNDKSLDSLDGIIQTRVDNISRKIRFIVEAIASLRLTSFNCKKMHKVVQLAWTRKDKECPIESDNDLESSLYKLCALGIFTEVGKQSFKFSHEYIGESAYSYALANKKESEMTVHLQMGKELTKLSAQENIESESQRLKFLAVHQLNLCSDFIDGDDRLKLCKFNQEAAEIAISKTSFRTAAIYLESGIKLLDPSKRWIEENYDISLRNFLYLARMKVCSGKSDAAKGICRDIFKFATSLKDKIYASHLMFSIMIEEGRYEEALSRLLALLQRMGEQFPPPKLANLPSIVDREVNNIREIVREKNNQELLRPEKMIDRKSLDTIFLLALLIEISEKCKDKHYFLFATIRMMHLSLKFGFSRQYPLAFACFGMVLMQRNLIKEAHRFGQVAEKTARPGDYYGGKAIMLFHWHISHWRRNYRRSLEPVLNVYNAQVDAGDFHNADFSITTYIQYHLASGFDLERLADNLQLFEGLFIDYDIKEPWRVSLPKEFIANFLGETESPLLFFGDTIDQQEAKIAEMKQAGQHDAVEYLHLLRLFSSLFFHDMETAANCIAILEMPQGVWVPWFYFIQSVVLISYLPETPKGKERKELKEKIEEKKGQLIDWYNEGAPNANTMVSILEVEYLVAKEGGKTPTMKAQQLYDEAVHAAVQDGAIHLQAYVCERAGMFFDKIGVQDLSGSYLRRAHKMYDNWSGLAKLVDVENRFADKLHIRNRRQRETAGSSYIRKNETMVRGNAAIGGGRAKVKSINVIKLGKKGSKGLKSGARKVKGIFGKGEKEELLSRQEFQGEEDETMYTQSSFREDPSKPRSSKLLNKLKSPIPKKSKAKKLG